MQIDINVIQARHIIFVVSWFAGLFYIVRLFIYAQEAKDMEEPKKSILVDQLVIMQKKLWKKKKTLLLKVGNGFYMYQTYI